MSAQIIPFPLPGERSPLHRVPAFAQAVERQRIQRAEPPMPGTYDLELEIEKLAELVAARALEKQGKARSARKAPAYVVAAGIEGTVDAVLRVVAWVQAQPQLPSAEAFMERWGMSRATAYRYRTRFANSGLSPNSRRC